MPSVWTTLVIGLCLGLIMSQGAYSKPKRADASLRLKRNYGSSSKVHTTMTEVDTKPKRLQDRIKRTSDVDTKPKRLQDRTKRDMDIDFKPKRLQFLAGEMGGGIHRPKWMDTSNKMKE